MHFAFYNNSDLTVLRPAIYRELLRGGRLLLHPIALELAHALVVCLYPPSHQQWHMRAIICIFIFTASMLTKHQVYTAAPSQENSTHELWCSTDAVRCSAQNASRQMSSTIWCLQLRHGAWWSNQARLSPMILLLLVPPIPECIAPRLSDLVSACAQHLECPAGSQICIGHCFPGGSRIW